MSSEQDTGLIKDWAQEIGKVFALLAALTQMLGAVKSLTVGAFLTTDVISGNLSLGSALLAIVGQSCGKGGGNFFHMKDGPSGGDWGFVFLIISGTVNAAASYTLFQPNTPDPVLVASLAIAAGVMSSIGAGLILHQSSPASKASPVLSTRSSYPSVGGSEQA